MVDSLLLHPERFVAGGESLARDDDGRIVFVRGGLPGEEVVVRVDETKSDWRRGTMTDVVKPSVDRVEPPCSQRRAGCGGCDWQHLAVPAQLSAKVSVVIDALRRTAKLPDADVRVGAAVLDRGYRTTIRVVGDAAGRPAYRVERSHDTVPADGCLIAHPALLDALSNVRVPAGLELTVRTSVATGETTAHWDHRLGEVAGLPDAVATGPDAALVEVVGGRRLRVSAGSFFQSGPAAAALLVDAVATAAPELADARRVLDAYSGVGLLGFTATASPTELVMVESSRSAVEDCRVNAAGRVAHVVRSDVASWRPRPRETFDVTIADPARAGLDKAGVAAVVAARAPVLVLVSCDPVSLARDARLLAAAGYRCAHSVVLDLFPHTHHVEVVTRFVLAD